MKRLIWIILALLLLLCGCGAEEVAPTETTEATVPPTEPVIIYMANSSVEQQTGGAVRVYVPEKDTYIGMGTMNGDVVLVSDLSKLTLVDGETGLLGASIKVGETISCEATDFTSSDKGVSYYRADGQELVFLNNKLQQQTKVEIPEGISGRPCVSHTNQEIYYCKDKEVRALHLETGISRLVKEQVCESIELVASHLDGTMLICKVLEEDGTETTLYLDSATGQTLENAEQLEGLQTGKDQYMAIRSEGVYKQKIFGTVGGTPQTFNVDEELTAAFDLGGAYRCYEEEGALVLDYYDLTTGTHSAQVRMVGVSQPVAVAADDTYIWILAVENNQTMLYRWDVKLSPTGNEHSYIEPLYTRENPNTEGLAQCKERATELKEKYGINFRVGATAMKETGGYEMEEEYQVQALTKMMNELETVLPKFPSKFLKKSLSNGKIYVCLVRSIPGNKEMVQFYVDGNAYIFLAASDNVAKNFLCGVAYIIDSHVLGNSRDYDTWKKLNPSDFEYDYNYYVYKKHEDSKYLSGSKRYFVDTYSMTFPHEDRSRLFAAAMMDGNEKVFESKYMQAKLKRMCQGIREAYGYEKNGKTYTWEQYLNTSLANKNS